MVVGLTEPPPDGLILQLAGPTDEGFRLIDVWENERAFKRFQTERLQPAVAALGGPSRPEPTFRDTPPIAADRSERNPRRFGMPAG